MLTKSVAKRIRELHDKKNRTQYGEFLVEGEKNVIELLNSDFSIISLFATQEFYNEHKIIIDPKLYDRLFEFEIITQEELEKLGTLESNNAAIAIVKQKAHDISELTTTLDSLGKDSAEIILALDDIRDPGNLGTIIRIADWYGIKKIVCSETTTDFYNSKTISATRGSFTRVQVFYTDLAAFLKNTNSLVGKSVTDSESLSIPVLGAFLEGENVHTKRFPASGILLMGSESHGISKELENLVTQKITIPRFGEAESLNVSIATAIILDNWKRTI